MLYKIFFNFNIGMMMEELISNKAISSSLMVVKSPLGGIKWIEY